MIGRKTKTAQENPVEAMTNLLLRLSDIMASETMLLKEFKVLETAKYNDEKREIVFRLETLKRHLAANQRLTENISRQDRQKFDRTAEIFSKVAQENYRELWKAREINRRVVEFIAKYVANKLGNAGSYNKKGTTGGKTISASSSYTPALSVNNII